MSVAFADMSVTFADMSVAFADMSVTLADMSVAFADMSVTLADMSVTLADMSVTLADMSVTFADMSVAFADMSVAFADMSVTLADMSVTLADMSVTPFFMPPVHFLLSLAAKGKWQEAGGNKRLAEALKRGMKMLRLWVVGVLGLLVMAFGGGRALGEGGERYASQSLLSSGKWVQLQVSETGVYKITYAELQRLGFSEPEKVSVHGYGGWLLAEDFRLGYTDDVPAVGVYRGADYLLFYGRGPVKWEYNEATGLFTHTNNPYATYGCYFLTDATETKEAERIVGSNEGASLTVTTFDDYRVYETDAVSVNKSGRELYGESFAGGGSQTLSSSVFQIPGITGEDGTVTMRFISRPKNTPGTATLSFDGQALVTATIGVAGSNSYLKAIAAEVTETWAGEKSENPRVTVSYSQSGDENVYLDYIRLQVKRRLSQYGACTMFRSIASAGNASRFVLGDANAETLVFDVTDGELKQVETTLSGSELSFTIPAGALREFAAVQANQALAGWTEVGAVKNQNLHGLGQTDMVILAQEGLRAQAERLAARHRLDNLRVEVVAPQEVYNEYSSGTPDATAYRRFMKMFYDRAETEEERPKYLLLFGDGSYDNRKLTAVWKQITTANMLLTYQSVNSLDQFSYVTDDYFGALEDTTFQSGPIQLGIGRFPVRTLQEATDAVDKVLSYMDNTQSGVWKNRVCFVADDGSAADGYSIEHAAYANRLGERIREEHPEFLVNKIYFDAYKKIGSSYPDVRQNIQKQLKDGLLLINYTGHGSTEKWADENVLTATDIAQFTYTTLPLWITATCDFTRFDDNATSAGETVFLRKSGGIALFTTTRVVYSSNNFELNNRLIGELFNRDANGNRLTLGDVMRNTKSKLTDTNKYNFILIGDPAMKLSYPEYKMEISDINGMSADSVAAFRAQDKITVRGQILSPDGMPATDFNGSLYATVLDSKQTVRMLNNNSIDTVYSYSDYPNTLYTGNGRVSGGAFEFAFTVPKDIAYSNDYGLMNLYASSDSGGREAQGAFDNFIVGGSSDHPEEDNEGPEIRQLFLNDSFFVDGGKTNATPFFAARLWDKTGVNITGSSIGHDIMLAIDNKPALSYNLNAYYRLEEDSDGEGWVTFSIPSLETGLHTAEFQVWDVLNNSTHYTFTFEVADNVKPAITDLIASPSPARENVTFYIYHNRPEAALTMKMAVYDMTGAQQWTTEQSGASNLYAPFTVQWNLTGSNGSRLRPGIYLYRVTLNADNSKEVTKAKKLIILAQ